MIDIIEMTQELGKRMNNYKREVIATFVGANALIKFLDNNKTESTLIVGQSYIRNLIAIGVAYEEAAEDYINYLKEQNIQYKTYEPTELVSKIGTIREEVKSIKDNINKTIQDIEEEMSNKKD